jgi:hypothetical protein
MNPLISFLEIGTGPHRCCSDDEDFRRATLQGRYVSARLPLNQPDQYPEAVLNRILWRATMGAKPYPEWAVKVVDDD